MLNRRERRRSVEFTSYISPDGEEYLFDDRLHKFLMSIEGEGMPPIEYITQQGPNQHGETVIDFRLNTRVVQLIHRSNGNDRLDYWDNRALLIDILRPNRNPPGVFNVGKLERKLPNGDRRRLDCFIQQGPVFTPRSPSQWDEYGFTESLRFIAHDPTFYDPVQQCYQWTLGFQDELIFPFTFRKGTDGNGLLFATDVIDSDISISYQGTWRAYPTIEITGPLSTPTIEHVELGSRIKLNYIVSSGEVVTITTAHGNKTVQNDSGVNLIGTVDEDTVADLTEFYIAPNPEVPGGTNTINVTGASAESGTTAVELAFYTRFIGI